MKKRVVIVKDERCPGCATLLKSLEEKGVQDALKAAGNTEQIDIVDFDKDPLGVNIAASLDTYAIPLITVLTERQDGKTEVCELDDDLKPKKCAELRELPP